MKYIKNTEDLCHKCLQEKSDIKTYSIYGRGYGSNFDNCNQYLQLCLECRKGIEEDLDKWFNENPEFDEYYEEYKYEENIINFIDNLPIQGREIVENQTSHGACAEYLESKDWIDIELGVASDKTYKKYGMYTPSEIKAYHDRFPTCKHTYLKVYSDGSAGTYCSKHIGVSGKKDFTCSSNISKECYYCNDYERKDKNFIHKVEKELLVEPTLVQMYEIFCPTCGHKILKYKYELEDGSKLYCNKCVQELSVNIEEDYTYEQWNDE